MHSRRRQFDQLVCIEDPPGFCLVALQKTLVALLVMVWVLDLPIVDEPLWLELMKGTTWIKGRIMGMTM